MISIIDKKTVNQLLPNPISIHDKNDFEWLVYDMQSYYLVDFIGDLYFLDSILIDGVYYEHTKDTFIKFSVYNEKIYKLILEIITSLYTDDISEKISDIMV